MCVVFNCICLFLDDVGLGNLTHLAQNKIEDIKSKDNRMLSFQTYFLIQLMYSL